jgi:hypothetical protein
VLKKFWPLALVLLLSLPLVRPLFLPGFFVSDDGEWMVIRLSDFHRSVAAGQMPVRWAARLNYGYGYPVFNFLYPLAFYVGEFFHLLGCSFVWSIKLVFLLSLVLSTLAMYFLARLFWGPWGGLVSAVLYLYAPYHLTDLYVRGSLGEAVAFIFPPIISFFLYRLSQKFSWSSVLGGGIAYAGLITAHNVAAFLFTLAFFPLMVWWWRGARERKVVFRGFASLLFLGLGLSAFFWLPALFDRQFTVFNQIIVADYRQYFLSFRDFFFFQMGWFYLAAITVGLIKFCRQTLPWVIFGGIGLFLALPISQVPWEKSFLASWVQFPWRFLLVVTFAGAFLAGVLVGVVNKRYQRILALILATLIVVINFKLTIPKARVNRPESFYTTNEATTTVKDEYLPIWVKHAPKERWSKKMEVIGNEGQIIDLHFNSRKIEFNTEGDSEIEVQVNTVYFPGWRAKMDGKQKEINYQNEQGVMRLVVPAGQHRVVFSFGETPIRLLADVISLVSFGFVFWLWRRRKQ